MAKSPKASLPNGELTPFGQEIARVYGVALRARNADALKRLANELARPELADVRAVCRDMHRDPALASLLSETP